MERQDLNQVQPRTIMKSTETKSFRVLVTDPINKAGIDILETIANVDVKLKLSESEICDIIHQYDALMIRSGTTVTDKIVRSGSNLRIIGRAGVGVDNVNIEAATEMGIFVVNSPLGNTIAAAEHTLCLLLALSRHITVANISFREGKWERSRFVGSQLQGKTLGIVGLGQVGYHVGRVARELGMNLLCYDPYANKQKAASLDAKLGDLESVLRNSDYITLHVPLVESTRNLIRKETIELMRPSARIVNTSRGGVVNELDLCEALESGRLAGAALDVLENEGPQDADSVLVKTKNLLITPHLGASTEEAQLNVALDVAEQIKTTLLGCYPQSSVNLLGLSNSEMTKLKPLIHCGVALGHLATHLLHQPVDSLSVTLEGNNYCQVIGDPILLSVAQGCLRVFSKHRVSVVNARTLAEKNLIKLSLTKEDYHIKNSIRVEARGGSDIARVKGTVTEDGRILLTLFKDIPIYMIMPRLSPEDPPVYMFYSVHSDVPGSLAKITNVLFEHKINVAYCHLGRGNDPNLSTKGLCVFHVDTQIPEIVLKSIRHLDGVSDCRLCLTSPF